MSRRGRFLPILVPILLLVLMLAACGGDGNDNGRFVFTLRLTGLPDSNTVFGHYEVWAIQNGVARSGGKFIIDGTGPGALVMNPQRTITFGTADNAIFGPSVTLLGESFPFISQSSHLFITIESEGDDDRVPSCQVVLAGEIIGQDAMLTAEGVAVPAEFPCAQPDGAGGFILGLGDFGAASGSFELMSPTDDVSNPVNNDFAGVWFLDTTAMSMTDVPSLNLPPLAGGLRYEAWAVVDGEARSLGTFVDPNGPDSDAMIARQRGPDTIGPLVPGGDFVSAFTPVFPIDPPMLDLVTTANMMDGDYRTFITVEPDIDNDPAPFQITVLDAVIPPDAVNSSNRAVRNVDLDSQFMGLPEATASMGAADVVLSDNGLTQLSAAVNSDRRGHFELWLDDGTAALSAGRFLIEGTMVRALDTGTILGTTTSATFDSAGTGIAMFPAPMAATSCFITLENESDQDAVPSDRVILQGNISGGVAMMTVAGDVANGGRGLEDFAAISGRFHLATPSDNAPGAVINDNMGIQFRLRGAPFNFNSAGLGLPVLPVGWTYEGWVEDRMTGRVFSTGRFFAPNIADSDHSTSASEGPEMKFALPGKGFLFDVMVPSLAAAQAGSITEVFITVEVDPDNDVAPSMFRVLSLTLPAMPAGTQVMNNVFPDSTTLRAEMRWEDGD